MPNNVVIECKPTKWLKSRGALILLMLAFFVCWFLKDGIWGYREENVQYVHHQLFAESSQETDDYAENAIKVFQAGDYTAESWAAYASQQVIPTPAADRGLLPRDYDYSTKWPEQLVNGYESLKSDEVYEVWKQYSGAKTWDVKAPEKLHDEGDIRGQFITAGICGALFAYAAFIYLRNLGRNMRVTETSYFAPGGKEVPFSAMRKMDKRKWANKGVSKIYYEEDGSTGSVKVDGFLYGQFQEEDEASAEALMNYIEERFKGELIEFVEEDEEEVASEESAAADSEGEKS